MTPHFFERHRKAIKAAARGPEHPEYCKPNPQLEAAIEQAKAEQPELFLTAEDLRNRRFVHAPNNGKDRVPVPHAYSLRKELTAQEVLEQVRIQSRVSK